MSFTEQKAICKPMVSPPITHKQYLECNFYFNPTTHLYQNYRYNVESRQEHVHSTWTSPCRLPPSPPTCSLTVPKDTNQRSSIMDISSIVNETSTEIITSRTIRKQKKPSPSPTSCSAHGAFNMPFIMNSSNRRGSNQLNRHSTSPTTKKIKQKLAQRRNHSVSPSFSKEIQTVSRQRPTSIIRNNNTSKQEAMENVQIETGELIVKRSTEAALAYDRLTADMDIATVFRGAERWIPSYESFNRKPSVRVQWRGHPLKIKHMPYYEKLHRDEATMAATLRLTPEQFLKCKWALILAAKEAHDSNSLFRKSEAQKVCCIDVNKTSALWNAFGKLGWLGPMWPQ